jgi:CRISPR-associated protein Cas2
MTSRHLLVSYDVTDDRRRTRLAAFLQDYVDRVQKSVFEGPVPDARVEALRRGVTGLIDHAEDSVRVYSLCRRCREATEAIGVAVRVGWDEDTDVVL